MSNSDPDDMIQSSLLLLSKLNGRKTCLNCWHHRDGGCNLYSCRCADDVSNHKKDPSRWTSFAEGEEIEQRLRRSYLR